jgi:Xaa-Pro dipeptidase
VGTTTRSEAPIAVPAAFDEREFADRRERVKENLSAGGLDSAIITTPENLCYLTGYDTPGYYQPQALFLPLSGEPFLFTYVSDVDLARESSGVGDTLAYGPTEAPMPALASAICARGAGGGRIGVELQSPFLPVALFEQLRAGLGEARLIDTAGAVEACRARKSPAETAQVRAAAAIASASMEAVAQAIGTGASENELAATAYETALRKGGEYPGSPPYVSSGPRVVHPHASWTRRRIEPGDQVHIELSGCVSRYCGALMRTFIYQGELTGELARLEAAIIGGLEAAIAALRPGVRSADVDEACRSVIRGEGFAYEHETGYSIGIAYPPGWNETHVFNLKPGDPRTVEAGMTFHLVPHVVLPGLGTVGLSETVLVTRDGCEILTSFPRRVGRV